MKVIKDNYNKFPIEVVCKHCKSVILLEEGNDIKYEVYPDKYRWECPCCSYNNVIFLDWHIK